jgi:hypothetical protein
VWRAQLAAGAFFEGQLRATIYGDSRSVMRATRAVKFQSDTTKRAEETSGVAEGALALTRKFSRGALAPRVDYVHNAPDLRFNTPIVAVGSPQFSARQFGKGSDRNHFTLLISLAVPAFRPSLRGSDGDDVHLRFANSWRFQARGCRLQLWLLYVGAQRVV